MSGAEMRINGVRGEAGGAQACADSAALLPNTAPDSADGTVPAVKNRENKRAKCWLRRRNIGNLYVMHNAP
jgi:hypothetical protein